MKLQNPFMLGFSPLKSEFKDPKANPGAPLDTVWVEWLESSSRRLFFHSLKAKQDVGDLYDMRYDFWRWL